MLFYTSLQIYWTIDDKNSPYETLVKWWSDLVECTDVSLYIGQNINNVDIGRKIDQEMTINRTYCEVEGSIFFSMRNIDENTGNVVEQFKQVYSCKAVTPVLFKKSNRT